jgi:hypothetical protein
MFGLVVFILLWTVPPLITAFDAPHEMAVADGVAAALGKGAKGSWGEPWPRPSEARLPGSPQGCRPRREPGGLVDLASRCG